MLVLKLKRRLALLAMAIALLAAHVGSPAEASAAGRADAQVTSDLRTTGTADGIVVFDHERALSEAVGRSGDAPGAVLGELRSAFNQDKAAALTARQGVQVLEDYRNLPVSYVQFTSEAGLQAILGDPRVKGVAANPELEAMTAESLPIVRQPHVAAAGFRGRSTEVAVLDWGVDLAAFGCTEAGGACPIREAFGTAGPTYTVADHGTNVAGIVNATAPHARIISIDVFGSVGGAALNDVISGLDEVLERRGDGRNIRSVNISIGWDDTSTRTHCDTFEGAPNPLIAAFAELRAVGTLPVVAAGNTTREARTRGILFPACTAGAVSVGAVADFTGELRTPWCRDPSVVPGEVACFSQTAPILSLLAPGATVTAAGIPMFGTSMAAPFVAGAAAVLASARRTATADQLNTALTASGTPIVDPDTGVTHPRLQMCAALRHLLGRVVCSNVRRSRDLIYTAATNQDNSIRVDADAGGITFIDDGLFPIDFGDDCSYITLTSIRCPSRPGVRLSLGDRDDVATINGAITSWILGAAGNDSLTGNVGADRLSGGAGNDVLDSGRGKDRLIGGAGDDTLRSGLGTASGLTDAGDVLIGGTGRDVANYSSHSRGVSISLDSRANDGIPGEGDSVDADDIIGSRHDDLLSGNAAQNLIRGGAGSDWLIGNAGRDLLYGEADDDHLDARDGERDLVVNCGLGDDSAWADFTDPVSGCDDTTRG